MAVKRMVLEIGRRRRAATGGLDVPDETSGERAVTAGAAVALRLDLV